MSSVDTADPTASAHAPTTGRLKRWLGPFYFTGVFWYRFHLFGVRVVPDSLVPPILSVFTVVFFFALPRVRKALAANLELVLGPCGFWERQRRVWKSLHTFAWCLSERYEQFVPGKEFEDTLVNEELWAKLRTQDEGFVMVTAHLGNWELASMLSGVSARRECHVIREQELDEESQAFVGELLARSGRQYHTHYATDDPQVMLELRDALRDGSMVALQADRPRAGSRTALVELFGCRVPLPVGPAALARSADVPLVPVFFLRTGRRTYDAIVREPIYVPRTRDRHTDMEEATRRVAAEIEWAIRRSPHEWFAFIALEEHAREASLDDGRTDRARLARATGKQAVLQ